MNRLIHLIVSSILLVPATGGVLHAQIANFNATTVSGCDPTSVQFVDASSGPITSYYWTLGNGATSTLQNPSTTYTTPGNYSVTLTVTGPSGSNFLTKSGFITIYDKPVVSFTASNLAGCTPHTTQFTSTVTPNSPGNVSYFWSFGDGTIDTAANPSHTYLVAGIYTISLTATNGAGCHQTTVQSNYVTAYPLPAVHISASDSFFCSAAAAVVAFNNSSTSGTPPFTSSWIFGDGGTGTGNAITHAYATSGKFSVTLQVTDAHTCNSQLVKQGYITVNDTPATFNMLTSGCIGVRVGVINTSPDTINTTWNFGDGYTDRGSAASHIYTTTGTYNVTMSTYFKGCTKMTTTAITIHPKPAATITMFPSMPCPAPVNVTFTGNSPLATQYDWKWLSGPTDTGHSVIKPYAFNMADQVWLYTTSVYGCKDTVLMDTVYIRDIEVHIFPEKNYPGYGPTRYAGCLPLKVDFSEVLHTFVPTPPTPAHQPYPVQANSWSWNFGDGSTSTSSTPSHTYSNIGDYNVRCVITTPNQCADTGYTIIHVDTPVHPDFYGLPPFTICPKTPVTFINTTDTVLAETIFAWEILYDQDPTVGKIITRFDTSRITYSFPFPGTYSISLAAGHRNCVDTFVRHSYVTVSLPKAEFSDSVYCSPTTTVKFINKSIGSTSQVWSFGDGTIDTAFSPVHPFPDTGTYDIRLVAYSSITGCTDTFIVRDTLLRPTFDFTVSDTTACIGQYLVFSANSTGLLSAIYGWKLDNFYTSYNQSNALIYAFNGTTGYHDVTLYISSGNNCRDSLTKAAFVLVAQPYIKFGAYPPLGCEPLPVLFVDSTTDAPGVPITQRYWIFGDGDSTYTSLASTTHIYPDTGRYNVYLKVTDSLGCYDFVLANKFVKVHRAHAEFTTADSACRGTPVQFNSVSTSTTSRLYHYWNFGDGTTDTGRHPYHSYTSTGYFTVRLIVIDSAGCTDTMLKSNIIKIVAPQAAFTMSDSISVCSKLTVYFTSQSTGANTNMWNFGSGGALAYGTTPSNTYTSAGIYTVTLVAVNSSGCTDTARAVVKMLGYNGAFTYTPLVGCVPLQVQFNAPVSNNYQITWDFADGYTQTTTGTTVTHPYYLKGAHVPRVIFSDGKGCFSSSIGLDTIKVDDVTADFSWSVPCVGAPFMLKDSSIGYYHNPDSWLWLFGGNTGSGARTAYTFNTPGMHSVTLIAINALGCKDTITKNVFINPLPVVDAGDNQPICPGDSTIFTATGALTYTWTPAALVNCLTGICDAVRAWTAAPTTYYVSGTDTNGCVGKDSAIAFIQIKTETHVGTGGEICVGESFQLFATGATRYSWTPAATLSNGNVNNPIATPQITTTYILEAQKTTCLISYDTITVMVHPLPIFDAGFDETVNLGESVLLHPTKRGIDHILWRQDTTLSCNDCFEPRARPYYTKMYYATGYDEYGCGASDSVTVFVRCNGSLVFIPNTFSPNGDGSNDYFFPRGEGVGAMASFRIFNRWGQMVYERNNVALNDEHAGWDGTYKGQALAPDVYMYTMQARCEDGKMVTWKGDVTLVR